MIEVAVAAPAQVLVAYATEAERQAFDDIASTWKADPAAQAMFEGFRRADADSWQ